VVKRRCSPGAMPHTWQVGPQKVGHRS
jgi:hypothetical protein